MTLKDDNGNDGPRGILPSEFMRARKPELYSDSTFEKKHSVDKAVLNHHLDTITDRNEHHDFEIFCRKLCEKEICPNLRPQTGPEGGGDGKIDTETYPVSAEIQRLWYVGDEKAASERWAFAFSARKDWSKKVRADVANIAETNRGYARIIFVTNQSARSKNRMQIEDDLTEKYGIPVTIHDRMWIIEKVFDNKRFDIVINYLRFEGNISNDKNLGPKDYGRESELKELEVLIEDPAAYNGVEYQRVEDALVAAVLSRNLERPKAETAGKFRQTISLAENLKFGRQLLRAKYEYAWSMFWYFDDFNELTRFYGEVEALVLDSRSASDFEFLSNLMSVLHGAVSQGHLDFKSAKIAERTSRIEKALEVLSSEGGRSSNALLAETFLTLQQLEREAFSGELSSLAQYWSKFSSILSRSEQLLDYPVRMLVRLNEAFAEIVGDDPEYDKFVEQIAEVVSKREGDGKSGELLLSQAKRKLDQDKYIEAISLLGRASVKFSKNEYRNQLFETLYLIAHSYRSAGLLWAARAACLGAAMNICADIQETDRIPRQIIPTIKLLAWISIELGHVPDIIFAFESLSVFGGALSIDDQFQDRIQKDLFNIDGFLAASLLTVPQHISNELAALPDILGNLGMNTARIGVLYLLGHEERLREEGWISNSETPEAVGQFFSGLAEKAVSEGVPSELLTFENRRVCLRSVLLGVNFEFRLENTENCILLAEAILSYMEALFSTSLNVEVYPHAEQIIVEIEESKEVRTPEFAIDNESDEAQIWWPKEKIFFHCVRDDVVSEFLLKFALYLLERIASVPNPDNLLQRIFKDEQAIGRALSFCMTCVSYSRFADRPRSSFVDWEKFVQDRYIASLDRPILKVDRQSKLIESGETSTEVASSPERHTGVAVKSVINPHLWKRAGWEGIAYITHAQPFGSDDSPQLPVMGLFFNDREAGRKIFKQWSSRFGSRGTDSYVRVSIIRGISKSNEARYRVHICSQIGSGSAKGEDAQFRNFVSKYHTMDPQDSSNLNRFLAAFNQTGSFFLTVVDISSSQSQMILHDASLHRKNLIVTDAWKIGPDSIDGVAIQKDDDVFIPPGEKNAPVLEVLKARSKSSDA